MRATGLSSGSTKFLSRSPDSADQRKNPNVECHGGTNLEKIKNVDPSVDAKAINSGNRHSGPPPEFRDFNER